MGILQFQDISPAVDDSAFLAEGAILVGEVCVSAEASIWFNAVLRGDEEPIRIGKGSNIQDGAVLHTDPGCPCTVGEYVTVGHNAILHGCTVDRGATIGMGATVLNHAPGRRGIAGGGKCARARRHGSPAPDAGRGRAGQSKA